MNTESRKCKVKIQKGGSERISIFQPTIEMFNINWQDLLTSDLGVSEFGFRSLLYNRHEMQDGAFLEEQEKKPVETLKSVYENEPRELGQAVASNTCITDSTQQFYCTHSIVQKSSFRQLKCISEFVLKTVLKSMMFKFFCKHVGAAKNNALLILMASRSCCYYFNN